MNKTLKVVLSVAIVIALGGAYVFPQVKNVTEQVVGSVVGPDFYSDYFGVNDVRTYPTRKALATATTTPCAVKSPSATSTLTYAGVKVTTATSTATTWTLAKATTAYATTTLLGVFSLSSGAQGTMVATTTPSGATNSTDSTLVIAPSTYIVFGVSGIGALTSDKLLGVCQVQFTAI